MVTRHRLNLSLSEADYQRVADLAASEGKTPSTFAADVIKAILHKSGYVPTRMRKTASEPSKPIQQQEVPTKHEKTPIAPPDASQAPLSRQQRRALERLKKKGRS